MILAPIDSLAMIAGPWPLLAIAVLVVGFLAPQMLPRIGRMLGRAVRAEMLRRLGMSPGPSRRPDTARQQRPAASAAPPVEILMPDRPAVRLRAESEQPLSAAPETARIMPAWLVASIVLIAAAAIFWLLLHSR